MIPETLKVLLIIVFGMVGGLAFLIYAYMLAGLVTKAILDAKYKFFSEKNFTDINETEKEKSHERLE